MSPPAWIETNACLTSKCRRALTGAWPPLTATRQHSSTLVNTRQHSSTLVNTRQHSSTLVNTRQHSSTLVNTRQHSSTLVNIATVDQHSSALTNVDQLKLVRRALSISSLEDPHELRMLRHSLRNWEARQRDSFGVEPTNITGDQRIEPTQFQASRAFMTPYFM